MKAHIDAEESAFRESERLAAALATAIANATRDREWAASVEQKAQRTQARIIQKADRQIVGANERAAAAEAALDALRRETRGLGPPVDLAPLADRMAALNATLGGAVDRPQPAAAVLTTMGPTTTIWGGERKYAVAAAAERPHFLMRAPPRVATSGVNSSSNHSWSSMTSPALSDLMRAFTKSGTCVVEWLPQMVVLVTEA